MKTEDMSAKIKEKNIPISTKWLIDAVGETGRTLINHIFMIFCTKTNSKGTGFLYKSGHIITNEHVIRNCAANDVIAIDTKGNYLRFSKVVVDENKDLALLYPEKPIEGGLEIDSTTEIKPGVQISTWGYPLGYNGPAPLLSVGYISGFIANKKQEGAPAVKHLIVNGAFNPGNSGGPLLVSGKNKLIGVVVTKHAPITRWLHSAMQALADNKNGLIYTATDEKGNQKNFAESQIVAELLTHLRDLTQVMLGEAIDRSELVKFLKENDAE